jgi:hypothetical protein
MMKRSFFSMTCPTQPIIWTDFSTGSPHSRIIGGCRNLSLIKNLTRRAMMIGVGTYPLPLWAQPINYHGVTRYGTKAPPRAPVGWQVKFFDDFTAFNQGTGTDLWGNPTGTATTGAQYPMGSGRLAQWNTGFYGKNRTNPTELQCYCNPTRNGINPFSHSGSILSIDARMPTGSEVNSLFGQPMISGALSSELFIQDAMDGYYEARIKFGHGANGYSGGLWGA